MNYTVEGQQVISGLDVVTQAGGVNKAYLQELEVTVADGDGLRIDAEGDGDVFEAGLELEVISITEPPIPDAGSTKPAGDGGVSSSFDGGNAIQRPRPALDGCAVGLPALGDREVRWGLCLVLAALLVLRRRRQRP